VDSQDCSSFWRTFQPCSLILSLETRILTYWASLNKRNYNYFLWIHFLQTSSFKFISVSIRNRWVSTVAGLRDGQRFHCQQAPQIRSFSKSPDRPWDPLNGYKELLLQEHTGRVVKPITHLILGLRVSIHGAVPPFPACLHGQRPLSSFRRNSLFQAPVQQSLLLTTTPCRSTAADYISGQHNLRSATTWT
jgi:hypothetical protein